MNAKPRGRYTQPEKATERVKLYVKPKMYKGKKPPTLRLTLQLPEDVVRKILPQMERFLKALKDRRSAAKD
jgi:hypothetical protein